MTGTCKFAPDKLTVTINKNSGDSELTNYDVITFVREPLEE